MASLNISVVGATGIVGKEFLKILEEKAFPCERVKLFASAKSAGEKIKFQGRDVIVEALFEGCFEGDDVAFFSAGAEISRAWAPRAVAQRAFVIDNSSAFRMDKAVSLVVPEVNSHALPSREEPSIIANPNCSTIQLVVALKPLHEKFGLRSVTVATYQSVSGAGKEGQDELIAQTRHMLQNKKGDDLEPGFPEETSQKSSGIFAHTIAFNNLPHIDKFDSSGYTYEELKVINETRKIMELPDLPVSVTAVRTPTLNGHSEAVWVELEKEIEKTDFMEALKNAEGLVVQDEPAKKIYPLNARASGKDPVFVGRIRRDFHNSKRWLMWVVADNVRKGAALNGVQIAQKLFDL